MSLGHGASVVRNGLVLYLDAANPKSYPGSGTVWKDLSSNKIDFNLVGSVTFTNGYFTTFTEATNYFEIANASNISKLPLGSADRTVLALCKTPASYPVNFQHVFHYGSSTTGQAFGIAVYKTGHLFTHIWGTSPSTVETIPTNTSVFLGVSYTQTTSLHRFFRNSIELSSANATSAINTVAANARVGSRLGPVAELWQTTGQIAVVMVYNRVLSATEIKQNYEALRGRYGI